MYPEIFFLIKYYLRTKDVYSMNDEKFKNEVINTKGKIDL